ncbi:MBOAT family O-acyltransferase [Clostridium perfringens]|uniref:MBOAT family protein n=1 Tax=Clostridium perfringens TaxID=1502 RepID=A0A133N3V8_CLOPF|nr:MBOAT family O-acyltransferase [Clostridium perfringens]KXA10962.1 MBOAT family protein [Clostridium perfringens]MBS5921324.1 MBOAT family protein [Clostridium perfringens]MCH1963143.1 MBOAT family protein [Clostridium perfringens]HAT4306574.1 MBOAT family protein [Clostridium perfringens]
MVFSSIMFIFRFLPIMFIIYYLTPKKFKNLSLLILSLVFYSWGEPKYFIIMLLSIGVDYSISIFIEKYRGKKIITKVLLFCSLIFNLGMLILFKYLNFFIENINLVFGTSLSLIYLTLPLGISFYTFQTMSYTIDVYRGKIKAERNIINFGAYVCLFPQLIAGPIVKYSDIKNELKNRKIKVNQVEEGITEFIIGMGKKVLIANNIGLLWNEIQELGINYVSTPLLLLGVIAFSFQIYFDFSGYSSMAIGLGKMLGFDFPENFNFPYMSRSITEFWRRWHITLGAWFKEYVYIPMGGNRLGKNRTILNLFVVWFLTGFWHGAKYNFIIWGLYFFFLIVIEKVFLMNYLNKYKIFSHIYAIVCIVFGWALFSFEDLLSIKYLFQMEFSWDFIYYLRNYFLVMIIAILGSTKLINNIYERFIKKNKSLECLVLMIVFTLSVAYLVDSTYNPFLYFRF